MSSVLHKVSLSAVSAVLPPGRVSVEDELQYYGGDAERARKIALASGLHTRRTAGPDVTASDLCVQAAEHLLNDCGVDRKDIGALFFISHSPDYFLPATASIQQHLLGLPSGCLTMDMNVGCTALVNSLWIAGGLIASGACAKALLLLGETPTRFLDPANRVTLPVFGDGGTAVLLERDEAAPPMSFLFGTDGGKFEALAIPGGGSRIPQRQNEGPDSPFNAVVRDGKGNPWRLGGYGNIWMDGMAIYSFGVSVVPKHIRRHLAEEGLEPGDLDYLLMHQANKVINDQIVRKLGLDPARAPGESLGRYGNMGGASIPALICEHFAPGGEGEGRLAALEGARTMICGFGVGLTWGSCLLAMNSCRALPVRDYVPPPHQRTRDEHIAHWHTIFAGETK